MGVPTISKTWQFSINNRYATSATVTRDALLGIKNLLLGFASNPWTVYSSCNSVSAGTDGDLVDRWSTSANLVYVSTAGSAHSWIVLKQAGILSNFQICIDLVTTGGGATDYGKANIYVSPSAGFAGGTTTNRPTATDEAEITPIAQWGFSITAVPWIIHAVQSTDGQCTRIYGFQNGFNSSLWILDKIQNARAAITEPFIATVLGTGTATVDAATVGNFWSSSANAKVRFSTTYGQAFLTCEGVASVPICSTQGTSDDLDHSYPITPMGVLSTTAGARGWYGNLADTSYCGTNTTTPGETFDRSTNTHVQLARFVFPSNGALWMSR